jgi:hypothetical protein
MICSVHKNPFLSIKGFLSVLVYVAKTVFVIIKSSDIPGEKDPRLSVQKEKSVFPSFSFT